MLNREQSRAVDQRAIEHLGIPGIVLMENAGRGCAEILWNELQPSLASTRDSASFESTLTLAQTRSADQRQQLGIKFGVVVCCGPGNNGGDGFVIARHLALAGLPIKVVLTSNRERYRGDALTNLHVIERLNLEILESQPDWGLVAWLQNLSQVQGLKAEWIVDALLGTGAQGGLTGSIRTAVEAINQCPVKRMAVDFPTGLDCDTGESDGCAVRADLTCTFFAPKVGFQNPKAAQHLGRVVVVGIGVPSEISKH